MFVYDIMQFRSFQGSLRDNVRSWTRNCKEKWRCLPRRILTLNCKCEWDVKSPPRETLIPAIRIQSGECPRIREVNQQYFSFRVCVWTVDLVVVISNYLMWIHRKCLNHTCPIFSVSSMREPVKIQNLWKEVVWLVRVKFVWLRILSFMVLYSYPIGFWNWCRS